MHRRPSRTAPLLFAVTVVVVVALAWPRTADGGGNPPATSTTVARVEPSAPPAPPSGLEPGLVAALDVAMAEARIAGHRLTLTSGFRTVAEQEALLADAIEEHGPVEAHRWVFTPDRSMHVRGLAVDVGDRKAAAWLDDHGARFGLCRTLDWEWWHFEWRAAWQASATCPAPVNDPADAPG